MKLNIFPEDPSCEKEDRRSDVDSFSPHQLERLKSFKAKGSKKVVSLGKIIPKHGEIHPTFCVVCAERLEIIGPRPSSDKFPRCKAHKGRHGVVKKHCKYCAGEIFGNTNGEKPTDTCASCAPYH
ncbi:hypothetical protein BH11PAT4_BH11PAT4_2230 [soil metagenome]